MRRVVRVPVRDDVRDDLVERQFELMDQRLWNPEALPALRDQAGQLREISDVVSQVHGQVSHVESDAGTSYTGKVTAQ
jgi:hypothetical protein